MAYLASDKDGTENIFSDKPNRFIYAWCSDSHKGEKRIELPKGSIAKLIGRELTWEDEPVELK